MLLFKPENVASKDLFSMMMYQTCFALGRPDATVATGLAFVAAVATDE